MLLLEKKEDSSDWKKLRWLRNICYFVFPAIPTVYMMFLPYLSEIGFASPPKDKMIDITDYLDTPPATGAMATTFSIPMIFMWNILRFDKSDELREHKLRHKIPLVLFNIAFELFLIVKNHQFYHTKVSFVLYASLVQYLYYSKVDISAAPRCL